MIRFGRSLSIISFTFFLLLSGVSASTPPSASHGDRGDGSKSSTRHNDSARRKDPCDHRIDHHGKGKEIDPECVRGGSSSGIAKGDFNGDGFGDLAIGIPFENVDGKLDAGAVNVIYGSAVGLCAAAPCVLVAAQLWSQNTSGIPGDAETDDAFGSALASGDFNGDGCSDLAIGVPLESFVPLVGSNDPVAAGAVNVIYGSNVGLIATGTGGARCGTTVGVPAPQIFSFKELAVAFDSDVESRYWFRPKASDHFGAALAWGDFDHDGKGDLAVGIPFWDVQEDSMRCNSTIQDAGAVAVFHGGGTGLRSRGDLWTQHGEAIKTFNDEAVGLFCANGDIDIVQDPFFTWDPVVPVGGNFDIQGAPETNDHFGAALAGGDFDGDFTSDLAVGVPGENIGDVLNAGAVNVIYGSTVVHGGLVGLASDGNEFWSQGAAGVKGTLEEDDGFGSALAAGDFDGDGNSDLAVGVPLEDVGSLDDAGLVNVFYGTSGGLTDAGDQVFDEGNVFAQPAAQAGAQFGFALAAGDFDGDGAKELAIGAPFENVTKDSVSRVDAGHVVVVYGGLGVGLRFGTSEIITQGLGLLNGTVTGEPELRDHFGSALTAWNFGRTAQADLAIGVPGEALSATGAETPNELSAAGQVNVLYGGGSGLFTLGQQRWTQASTGVPGDAEASDGFGAVAY